MKISFGAIWLKIKATYGQQTVLNAQSSCQPRFFLQSSIVGAFVFPAMIEAERDASTARQANGRPSNTALKVNNRSGCPSPSAGANRMVNVSARARISAMRSASRLHHFSLEIPLILDGQPILRVPPSRGARS